MSMDLLHTRPIKRLPSRLKTTTVREFDGGLNEADNELNLDPRFSKVLKNMYRQFDGSIGNRFGTRLFTDIAPLVDSNIINAEYFNNFIIVVSENGDVSAIDASGTVSAIWNATVAAALPGSPDPWSSISFCSFDQFKGDLTIHNGIDKPLIVKQNLFVDYLHDLATVSNINTPIGRYVYSISNFTIIAGDPLNKSLLHISNGGTSGTYLGDVAPNDAVQFDLGSRVPVGDSTIKGLGSFANKLAVVFENATILVTLGAFDSGGNHTPTIADADVIPQHGAVSHRVVQTVGSALLFTDIVGVPSLSSTALVNLRAERVSELVDPLIQKALTGLSTATLEDDAFALYNRKESQYLLFIPGHDSRTLRRETRCFAFTRIPKLRIAAWAEFRGWNFQSAAVSVEGRVFFTKGTEVFIYGNQQDEFYADQVGACETFSDGTKFRDNTGWFPFVSEKTSGIPVDFDWELPWADFDRRMDAKNSKYIGIETTGEAQFTLSMFVDRIDENKTDPGEDYTDGTLHEDGFGFVRSEPLRLPALSMDFVAGDRGGMGVDGFGNLFGGGRTTAEERLYAWPAKFKIAKFRANGSTVEKLRIVSLSLAYNDGTIRR